MIAISSASPPIVRLSRSCHFSFRSRCAAILSLLVAKVTSMIEIVAGEHVPDLPFVIVDGRAATQSISPGSGELWDELRRFADITLSPWRAYR
jgi:hypothetical protein